MKVTVKKIWFGGKPHGVAKVSIRNYVAKKCIRNKKPLKVLYNDKVMTLTPKDLLEKLLDTSPPIPSKVNRQTYKLWDYEWEPDKTP